MEHIYGPFAGLKGLDLVKKIYRGNSQTLADINEEFFMLAGGENNIKKIYKTTDFNLRKEFNDYIVEIHDLKKTGFFKNPEEPFFNRLICSEFYLSVKDDHLIASVRDPIESHFAEYAKMIDPQNEVEVVEEKKE